MRDPEYRREYERTQLASDIAIEVIRYRAEHNVTQAGLGRMIGMRQPHVARLEAGDHEPSLATLAWLSLKLGLDLSVDIKPDRLGLRHRTRGSTGPACEDAVGRENAAGRRAG
jgi:transcriptional regulator with XRE-family HTH domain